MTFGRETDMKNTTLAALAFSLLLAAPSFAQEAFKDEDVQRAKAFFTKSAGGDLDCLETLNEGMRVLYNDRNMRLASTVDLTMKKMAQIGRAKPARKFGFFDEKGRSTFGVTAPKTLRDSVWDGLIEMSGGVKGWHAFGFSPLDGNHSVTLFLDNNGRSPKVYWSDQWGTKGGFKLYPDKEALDGEIERLTASWWRSKLSELGIKFKTDAKIYQLIPAGAEATDEPTAEGEEEAEVIRAARLNLRSGPGTNHDRIASARKGDSYKVVGREGKWVQLENSDGQRYWAHGYFLQVTRKPAAGAAAALRGISAGR
jgi:SH3 domain-containing protein